MGYRRKAIMMHQGPNQIPAAVILGQIPKKGIWLIFPLVPIHHLAIGMLA